MPQYVVLDRDGTLIEHKHHLVNLSEVRFIPGVFQSLRLISSYGFRFGVVTNQSVVGRGLSTEANLNLINAFISRSFEEQAEIVFDFFRVCMHMPSDGCDCRKPKTGLLRNDIINRMINASESYMVGDQESDILFGRDLGMKTIRIDKDSSSSSVANHIIKNIFELPDIIHRNLQTGGNRD